MAGIFFFASASKPALGPTHPPIQWIPEVKRLEREADTHLHIELSLRMCGAIPPLPHMYSWRCTYFHHRENFYLYAYGYKSRRTEHTERMGELRTACKLTVGNLKGGVGGQN